MKQKHVFWWAFLAYSAVLVVLVVAASRYVYRVLSDYENAQPEYIMESLIAEMKADASSPEDFWKKYGISEVKNSEYEQHIDLKRAYLQMFSSDELNYTTKNGSYGEDELCYVIRDGKKVLVEIRLKSEGGVITKLAVFSWRNWCVRSIDPIFESSDYEITIPEEFILSVNGTLVPLEKGEEEEGIIKYLVNGLYFPPDFKITDGTGRDAKFAIQDNKVITEYYDYTLTLPSTLAVKINGEVSAGTVLSNGNVHYDIVFSDKPEVIISDLYGNSITYEGGDLPLTYMIVIAKSSDMVKIDGMDVAADAITVTDIPEYAILSAILEDVPQKCEYNIAVLKGDSKVTYSPWETNDTILLDNQIHKHDMMDYVKALDIVPKEVSDLVDVLDVAQSWSLYMSNDFGFEEMAALMLKGTYQYEVARKYNSSVDKTLFSNHELLSPAFTDSKVENFAWITENSFSVDISFVKHMKLATGKRVEDKMNDSFYFVFSGGKWLLAGLKEVSGIVE